VRAVAGILAGVVLAAVVGGCGGSAATASQSPSPSPAALPGHAEATDGNFHLAFDMPDTVVRSGEAIQGAATLSLQGVDSVNIGSSGSGLIVFTLEQIGGDLRGRYPITADLAERNLRSDTPTVVQIPPLMQFFYIGLQDGSVPSGVYKNSSIFLPPGEWKVDAIADFVEWNDVNHEHRLEGSISFHVIP
jgi:hypothetical protein